MADTGSEGTQQPRRQLAGPGELVLLDHYRIPSDMEFSVVGQPKLTGGTLVAAQRAPEDVQVLREELDFIPAPGAERIARVFIELDPRFEHLQEMNILFLWARATLGKKHPLGKTQLPSGLLAYAYRGYDFISQLSAEGCRDEGFGPKDLEALIMHELKHCGVRDNATDENGRPIPMIIHHDFEGFADEIERYGAWHSGARIIEAAFRQLGLDEAVRASHRRRADDLRLAFPAEGG